MPVGVVTVQPSRAAGQRADRPAGGLPDSPDPSPRVGRAATPRRGRGQFGQGRPAAVPDRAGRLPQRGGGRPGGGEQGVGSRGLAKFAYERNKPIFDAKASAPREFLNIETQHKLAQADWASAKANLQTAQLNLSYASVPSPITGRIGRALVTEGALVSAHRTPPLAVVQQMDPMRITFQQSATDLLTLPGHLGGQAQGGRTPA